MALLGVNIDHVATVRQARRTNEPDPVWAAAEAQLGGADGITFHLREDRRHIIDRDAELLKQTVTTKLNMENRSPDRHVFVMGGEVVSGGKQTRTIRKDIVLAPGQKLDIGAFCVEAGRWHGDQEFESSALMLPQSVQKELRKGTDQKRVWAEVDRINRSLGSQNATSSLEIGLNAAPVRKRLGRVRAAIVPKVPGGSIGFVFVYRGRAVGAEFFGRPDLARALLPKILDAYAVDFVLREPGRARRSPAPREHIAAAFLNHVRLAGSTRSETAGSGAGIRTRSAGLVGEGVSLGDSLVHFGVQIEKRIMPAVEKVPTRRGRVP